MSPDAQLVTEYPGFLSEKDCALISSYLHLNDYSDENWGSPCFSKHWASLNVSEPFRIGFVPGVDENTIPDIESRIRNIVDHQFGENSSLHFIKGHQHGNHAYTDPSSYKDFAAILFLNDGFEGGNFVMPQHNITIAPTAGSLIVFRDGLDNQYGVSEVISGGPRYSITATYYAEGAERHER